MAKVWTYADIESGAAQASEEFNLAEDLYEHPQYGPLPIPQEYMYNLRGEEEQFASWLPYTQRETQRYMEDPNAYVAKYGYSPAETANEMSPEEWFNYRLEFPDPRFLPSPEELERAKQLRIAQQGASRAKTRIASVSEMRNRRASSAYLAAQTALSPATDTLGAASSRLGTALSGMGT